MAANHQKVATNHQARNHRAVRNQVALKVQGKRRGIDMLIHLWTHFKTKMQCQRGFIVSTTVAGSAIAVGIAGAVTTSALGAGLVAGGIGLAVAGAVYTGAYFAVKGLMGGSGDYQQQEQEGFDPYAEQRKAETSANARSKRTRIAVAKNQTNLTRGNQEEAKLGTTGLLGAY